MFTDQDKSKRCGSGRQSRLFHAKTFGKTAMRGQGVGDYGILSAPLDELVECEFGVFIGIHGSENFVHQLFAVND